MTPLPPRVPELATVAGLLIEPFTSNVPPLTVTVPVLVFTPESCNVPAPDLVQVNPLPCRSPTTPEMLRSTPLGTVPAAVEITNPEARNPKGALMVETILVARLLMAALAPFKLQQPPLERKVPPVKLN